MPSINIGSFHPARQKRRHVLAGSLSNLPLRTHQNGAECDREACGFTKDAAGRRSAGQRETDERLAKSGAYGFFHLARDLFYTMRRECARDMGARMEYQALARKRDGPAV